MKTKSLTRDHLGRAGRRVLWGAKNFLAPAVAIYVIVSLGGALAMLILEQGFDAGLHSMNGTRRLIIDGAGLTAIFAWPGAVVLAALFGIQQTR